MKSTNKFRLFKRGDDGKEMSPSTAGYKDRPYYFRFTHRGKAYPRCLETPDATEAQRRAKAKYAEIVAAVSSGEYKRLDATKLRTPNSASLSDLFTAYRAGPSEANAKTREVNIHALRQIAGTATTLRELTPALVRQWFAAVQLATLTLAGGPGDNPQEAAASLKRSANSRWAQARSLFTDRCLAHYLDQDLIPNLVHLQEFVAAGNAATFNRIPKQNYNPPADEVIHQTLATWETLTDRDMFLAIGHELSFGLRLAEVAQARWDWHSLRNGYPVLEGRAAVKNGSGLIQVRALDPFYSTMKRIATANQWWGVASGVSPDTSIITGTDTYRTDGLFRAISDWLRHLGWETMKTNHALRAYAGSQVAMRYGIYEAQMFLRHSTVKVTEANYSHFVSKFKPADLDSIPARWAVVESGLAAKPLKVTSATKDDTLDATQDFRKTPLDSTTVLPWILKSRN